VLEAGNVIFVGADTARSRIYLQALVFSRIRLGGVFIFSRSTGGLGKSEVKQSKPIQARTANLDGFCADLNSSLDETSKRVSDCGRIMEGASINDKAVGNSLSQFCCELDNVGLLIYSGYGGEIIQQEVLTRHPPFLHIHSGWLPQYRGSTTIYYSLLQEGRCGVSAILLSRKIDQGIIVGRRWYAPPTQQEDTDYIYDSTIRADLLVSVVRKWCETGRFPDSIVQYEDSGTDYYVIHPVLKHIALLSLGEG